MLSQLERCMVTREAFTSLEWKTKLNQHLSSNKNPDHLYISRVIKTKQNQHLSSEISDHLDVSRVRKSDHLCISRVMKSDHLYIPRVMKSDHLYISQVMKSDHLYIPRVMKSNHLYISWVMKSDQNQIVWLPNPYMVSLELSNIPSSLFDSRDGNCTITQPIYGISRVIKLTI